MRIERIVIGAAKNVDSGAWDVDSCPSSVKIFINSDTLGFHEAGKSRRMAVVYGIY